MSGESVPGVSRRAVLTVIGLGALGAATGTGWYIAEHEHATPGDAYRHRRIDAATWVRLRGNRYYIAHRGSGDVKPEHTMQAYQAAAGWGALAMEISTSATSDGVLVCMHDLTLDRTTTARGQVNAMTAKELAGIGVLQPQLGPAWTRQPLPRIPHLDDVLARFGGHVVLCVEAKRDADYPLMMQAIERHGLQKSVIVKAFHTSSSIAAAKQAGYPVFSYLGSQDMTVESITAAASVLAPSTDCLVLPSTVQTSPGQSSPGQSSSGQDSSLPSAEILSAAVATGIPVWVYPVHRRSEAAYFLDHGVSGVLASSYHYLSGDAPLVTKDTWKSKAIASGEMTMHPDSDEFAPQWTGSDELTLAHNGAQHFVTLGQFAPVKAAAQTYQLDVHARWNVLPDDRTTNISLAFAHTDDRYYEHGLGASDGYHAIIRANGSLELYAHQAGQTSGQLLGTPVQTPQPVPGHWMRLRLRVTPQTITWTRLDSAPAAVVAVTDNHFRGGYLHIGRSAIDASSVSFRQLTIS